MAINKMKLSKKAQFYVFGAVLLCSLAASLVYVHLSTENTDSTYVELKNNFLTESDNVMDSSLLYSKDTFSRMHDFSLYFRNYSLSRGINFSTINFLVYDETIYIDNMLSYDIAIKINDQSISIPSNTDYNFAYTSLPQEISVIIAGVEREMIFNKAIDKKFYFDFSKI